MWRSTQPPDQGRAVALGLVPGWELLRRFGKNDAVNGSGTVESIWVPGTPRTLPAAAGVVTVSSTSAADDGSPAGTGAHTLLIQGLDSNYSEISEEITLNGTSGVATSKSFLRVNRMYITKSGSGGTNAGAITATIGGAAQAYIEALAGQTTQVMTTVPADKYWLVEGYTFTVGRMATGDARVFLQQNLYNSSRSALEGWRTVSDIYLYNGATYMSTPVEFVFPPKTEVRAQVVSTAATQVSAIIAGYLVRTDHIGNI